MDYYRQLTIDDPKSAPWAENTEALPNALRAVKNYWPPLKHDALIEMRRAYYALCTHIDHQLRAVLGTLREEKLLDNTIVLICSDHGDMLGDFGLYAKRTFYEGSARVPFILMGLPGDTRLAPNTIDNRLIGLQDIMPTLLDLVDLPIPDSCDGLSAVGEEKRSLLYGEALENDSASRMIHDGRHKLIWYPAGNHIQLFDLEEDPCEKTDLVNELNYAQIRSELEIELAERCYGSDLEKGYVKDRRLIGYDPGPYVPKPDRTFSAQRGLHYPQPPQGPSPEKIGFPE